MSVPPRLLLFLFYAFFVINTFRFLPYLQLKKEKEDIFYPLLLYTFFHFLFSKRARL